MSAGSQQEIDRLVADMEGAVALPRDNGELVFTEPWQSRAFGAAISLAGDSAVEWERFRQALIAEISRWEEVNGEDSEEAWDYYERWLAALEAHLLEREILGAEEIEQRSELIAYEQEHEHDHDHHHHHDGS